MQIMLSNIEIQTFLIGFVNLGRSPKQPQKRIWQARPFESLQITCA